MALLYADENFPLPIVVALRALGHDVLTVREAGQANLGSPDEEVLAFATNLGRAVLTRNRSDFKKLHRLASEHAEIVVCKEDNDFVGCANRIHTAISTASDLSGQLISIKQPQAG